MSAALALTLAACAPQERIVTKEVLVPVYQKTPAPDWLMAGYKPDTLPLFTKPGDDPEATSCIAPSSEKALRLIITDMAARDEQWRVWAK
jgi:hypothetical protein